MTTLTNKSEIKRQLHALVRERLVGTGPWSTDEPEVNKAMLEQFVEWGLNAVDPATGNITSTALGKELDVDLLSALAGHHEPYEVPELLELHGLITPEQADELIERFEDCGEQPEEALPPILWRLYKQHFEDV
jgi:hypothetical protein